MGLDEVHPSGWLLLGKAQFTSILTSGRTLTPHPPRYWPVLDSALRAAAFDRGVHVRLLVSCWLNTDPTMFTYLRSLQAFSDPSAGISVDVVRD